MQTVFATKTSFKKLILACKIFNMQDWTKIVQSNLQINGFVEVKNSFLNLSIKKRTENSIKKFPSASISVCSENLQFNQLYSI